MTFEIRNISQDDCPQLEWILVVGGQEPNENGKSKDLVNL